MASEGQRVTLDGQNYQTITPTPSIQSQMTSGHGNTSLNDVTLLSE